MTSLSASDRDLWRGFRRTYELINTAIERDLMSQTRLSGADHGILSRLAAAANATLRQQGLAELMRWDRTRLSHHLTRMEERSLLERVRLEGGKTLVRMTALGDRLRLSADHVHADAVMRRFVSKLTAAQRDAVAALAATTG